MIYTPLTKIALRLCFRAHRDQLDKNGVPYVFHPYEVASSMTNESEVCVALLHDVLEDTDMTATDLREAGMPDAVVEALQLLNHDKSVPYMEYVAHLAGNPLARAVKLSDLRHNSNLSRLEQVTEADRVRVAKYRRAQALLEGM